MRNRRALWVITDYLSKPVTEKESSDEANGKLNIGASSMQGWRTYQEDAHNVLLDFDLNTSLFAVYDGHGGGEVATYCSQNLPNYIKGTEAYKNRNFERALEDAFLGFDATLISPKVIAVLAKLRELRPRRTSECSATSSDNESSTNSATASVSPDTPKPIEENGSLQKPEMHVELADCSESDSKSKSDDLNPKNNEIEAKAGGDQPNQNGEVKQSAEEETPTEVEILQENGEISKTGKDIEEEDEDCDINETKNMATDVGCTAVVALLHENQLYVANAGDSRCIVCRNGKAVEMSIDHKPTDEQEWKRVFRAGGKVRDGRVNRDLNLSRSIGDHRYKRNKELSDREQMMTALPDLRTLTINYREDEFMVLACDGIWDRMSNQEVVDFIRPRIQKSPEKLSEICEEMFDNCLSAYSFSTGCDNMTAIIVQFKTNLCKRAAPDDDQVESASVEGAKTDEIFSQPENILIENSNQSNLI